MKQLKKLSLMLVALLSMATGAWAQDADEVAVTKTANNNEWTLTMPASNVELQVEYQPELTAAFKAGNANTIQGSKATLAVTESDGTTAYTGATLDENGKLTPLYEGQTITLTAAAGYKFRTVEVKKGGGPTYPVALSEVTADYLGSVVTTDGNVYATVSDATTAGKTAVAMIAYVGSSTEHATYTHGLAIALADESNSDWFAAMGTCQGKSAVTNAAWQLPSQNQWKAMLGANGGDNTKYTGLNNALAAAGGDSSKLQEGVDYWSSSEILMDSDASVVRFYEGNVIWETGDEGDNHNVRACLAF